MNLLKKGYIVVYFKVFSLFDLMKNIQVHSQRHLYQRVIDTRMIPFILSTLRVLMIFFLLSGCMINNDDGSTWMIFKIYINTNNLKQKHILIVQFIIFIDIH